MVRTGFQQPPHQNCWRRLLGGWQSVRWWWGPWPDCWEPEPAEGDAPGEQGNPLRRAEDLGQSHLPVDHVTNGHPHLHAHPLGYVVVDMLEDSQPERGEGQGWSGDVGHDQCSLVFWVVVLKVVNDFPQKKRLEHFNCLLKVKMIFRKSRPLEHMVTKYLHDFTSAKTKGPVLA